MVGKPKVEVFLIPELARQETKHVGYRAKAEVRVWNNDNFTAQRLDGPATVVATKAEANAIMLPIVRQWLVEKGWEHAEILERTDPVVDGRSAN